LEKVHLLVKEGVQVLICGGLTESHTNMLQGSGIRVIPWVQGEIEDVLTRFVRGTLENTKASGGSRVSV
jgi:predicted Fe-Mo cluster-binding NifX family protein